MPKAQKAQRRRGFRNWPGWCCWRDAHRRPGQQGRRRARFVGRAVLGEWDAERLTKSVGGPERRRRARVREPIAEGFFHERGAVGAGDERLATNRPGCDRVDQRLQNGQHDDPAGLLGRDRNPPSRTCAAQAAKRLRVASRSRPERRRRALSRCRSSSALRRRVISSGGPRMEAFGGALSALTLAVGSASTCSASSAQRNNARALQEVSSLRGRCRASVADGNDKLSVPDVQAADRLPARAPAASSSRAAFRRGR